MTNEDRLRQLMRDPGWSLPAWPDSQARVHRAARRQRLTAAGVRAAMAVIIVAAVVAPVTLLGRPPRVLAERHQPHRPSVTAQPKSPRPVVFPPVGSAGFPASIYPAATRPRAATQPLPLCPDPAGLEAPGPATAAAARYVLRRLGRGFTSDLHLSDRSAWPLLVTSWQAGGIIFAPAARASVRYSGPLQPNHGIPAGLRRAIVAECGTGVARATWVIVYGPAGDPALDAVILFLTRRGHMLFYTAV